MSHTRRKFLQNLSAGAAALSFPSVSGLPNSIPFQQKKLGIALLGLGYYAEHKLATALEETKNCYLAGIVTGTPAKAEKWKDKYKLADKNIYNYETLDRIADNPDIGAVYVATPNALHPPYAIRAAKAGKHVLCEKPMATSSKECQEMIDACKKAKVKLYIGYRLHFEPHNKEAARVGQKKEFGNVKIVETSMGFKIGDPTQWRLKKSLAGGGAMMDVGIYCIQGARYSTGLEPTHVTAREYKTDPVKFREVDETISWQMEFPDGAVSNSTTSYASSMDRLYISAENGWLELRPAFGYGPLEGRTQKGLLDLPKTNHQAVQLDEMALGILENRPIDATGEEGLQDMKIIEAIYRSIQSGKREKI